MNNREDSFEDWFRNVPPVTKFFTVATLILAALTTFRIISPDKMILIWPEVFERFQVWRLLSSFLYAGSFSFNFVMHIFVLYENFRRYEANPYNTGAGGNSADFIWLLLCAMALLLTISFLFELFVLSEAILYVVLYVWSRREPESMLNVFGLRFKSLYLPWFYVAIRLLMGGSVTDPLLGIAVGHIYFFFVQIFPTIYNVQVIRTPKFCVDLIRFATGLTPVSTAPASIRTNQETSNVRFRSNNGQNQPGSYNWGAGRTLGSN
eukprot:gene12-12_t